MMIGYTYMLRCSDGTFYVGSTKDLDTRLETHAQGLGSDYTSCRLPVQLMWWAEFDRIDEAFALEKRMQGWSHAKRLAFTEGGFDAIKGWSARERALRRGAASAEG
ncbi:GIY-YIG nuclease family protein [Microbacterium sp. H1-D42]|uniref:GIY-YIG nuclease family protein n=1 Tax=Microbacterium sp. H1-D42 TaxID=2925844 RepID=UPI001F534A39|nr:GIY-YIG nuclease family protein [Microbacterium sp. H1-D42]UNK70896.1 GIY-YIG nuclease family protein [Microbacterium sp. H1-D42]